MLRFRCPKCQFVVDVEAVQVLDGVATCPCGQKVRLPDTAQSRPAPAPVGGPPTEAYVAVQPAGTPPMRFRPEEDSDDFDVVEPADDDPRPRRLPAPGVDDSDGDNYQDFKRYREKPRRRRRRDRRDLPSSSL